MVSKTRRCVKSPQDGELAVEVFLCHGAGHKIIRKLSSLTWKSAETNYFQKHNVSKDGSSFVFRYKGMAPAPLDPKR
jgi:hypothetical protein